jgi:hypothetical protein
MVTCRGRVNTCVACIASGRESGHASVHVWWLHRSITFGRLQRPPSPGGWPNDDDDHGSSKKPALVYGKRRVTAIAVLQTCVHAVLKATVQAKAQPTKRTPTPRDWRHVHFVPHVAFLLPRRNTLCLAEHGAFSHRQLSCVVVVVVVAAVPLVHARPPKLCEEGGLSYLWLVDDEMGHTLALMEGISMGPIAA